jgi:hypothetical protein
MFNSRTELKIVEKTSYEPITNMASSPHMEEMKKIRKRSFDTN